VSRARELALLGAVLCATAALLAVPALYVPGVAALGAAALARSWVSLSARRVELELRCGAVTVQEDDRVDVVVQVRRGIVPFPAATLVPWPGARELALASGRTTRLSAGAVLARRGRHMVGPARVHITDPFGISELERTSNAVEVLVLPRLHPLSGSVPAVPRGAGRAPREAQQEIDALRVYRPGSPASRIHWPTVARTGVLMEHAMRAEQDARVLVELDADQPDTADALDRAVCACASLCVHLARRGGCLLLLPGDQRPTLIRADLKTWPALHARLALVVPAASRRRAPARRRPATLLRVSANARPPVRDEPHFRVAPSPLAGPEIAFTVAGCAGQFISEARAARAA